MTIWSTKSLVLPLLLLAACDSSGEPKGAGDRYTPPVDTAPPDDGGSGGTTTEEPDGTGDGGSGDGGSGDGGSGDGGSGDGGSGDGVSGDGGSGDGNEPVDADGDGYRSDVDCNDADVGVNPAAPEICDGLDNDCDTLVDDDDLDASGRPVWYRDADADADGYGDAGVPVVACAAPSGFVADDTDCNDTSASVSPGASEVCDLVDNNCDGTVDDDDPTVTDAVDWYPDSDSDGYGDPASSPVSACTAPAAHVDDATDCNDTDATISPAATELCDAVDNDCDGAIDDDDPDVTGVSIFYTDSDGDGYGDPAADVTAFAATSGIVANASDCNDSDEAIHPAAIEVCDLQDND